MLICAKAIAIQTDLGVTVNDRLSFSFLLVPLARTGPNPPRRTKLSSSTRFVDRHSRQIWVTQINDGVATSCKRTTKSAKSATSAMSMNSSNPNVPLLSAPSAQSLEDPSVPNVQVGATAPLKFDILGPMVVNSDGVGFPNRRRDVLYSRVLRSGSLTT